MGSSNGSDAWRPSLDRKAAWHGLGLWGPHHDGVTSGWGSTAFPELRQCQDNGPRAFSWSPKQARVLYLSSSHSRLSDLQTRPDSEKTLLETNTSLNTKHETTDAKSRPKRGKYSPHTKGEESKRKETIRNSAHQVELLLRTSSQMLQFWFGSTPHIQCSPSTCFEIIPLEIQCKTCHLKSILEDPTKGHLHRNWLAERYGVGVFSKVHVLDTKSPTATELRKGTFHIKREGG